MYKGILQCTLPGEMHWWRNAETLLMAPRSIRPAVISPPPTQLPTWLPNLPTFSYIYPLGISYLFRLVPAAPARDLMSVRLWNPHESSGTHKFRVWPISALRFWI